MDVLPKMHMFLREISFIEVNVQKTKLRGTKWIEYLVLLPSVVLCMLKHAQDPILASQLGCLVGTKANLEWNTGGRAAEKATQYLKGITNCMLTYKRSNKLEVIGYSNADFASCLDTSKSTSGYAFMLVGEQYRGEVLNKHLLLRQLFMLNSWRALKPRGGHHS